MMRSSVTKVAKEDRIPGDRPRSERQGFFVAVEESVPGYRPW